MEDLDTAISFRDGGSGMARDLQRIMAKGAAARGEKTLQHAYREIGTMCDQISLPKTIADTAKTLFKIADQEKVLRGKSMDATVACCIFIACRQGHVPRTFKEIGQLTNVSKKTLGQCYKILELYLNTNAAKAQLSGSAKDIATMSVPSGQQGPEGLLARFANHLDLPPFVDSAAKAVVEACRELGVAAGRSPTTIAAGAIYFASHLMGMGRTAKQIYEVSGVSDSTIKVVYKEMYAKKELIAPKEELETGRGVLSKLPTVSDR